MASPLAENVDAWVICAAFAALFRFSNKLFERVFVWWRVNYILYTTRLCCALLFGMPRLLTTEQMPCYHSFLTYILSIQKFVLERRRLICLTNHCGVGIEFCLCVGMILVSLYSSTCQTNRLV